MTLADILYTNRFVFDARKLYLHNSNLPLENDDCAKDWQMLLSHNKKPIPTFLNEVFIQLAYPIELGISTREDYTKGSLRGELPKNDFRVNFRKAEEIQIYLSPSPAGSAVVLEIGDDEDFVEMVQRLCCKNEPKQIPKTMGSALVLQYNNWARIRLHQEQGLSWAFIMAMPNLFKDSSILLSARNYSGLPATLVGYTATEWKKHSVSIRRGHELAHYMTKRFFGGAFKSLHDEIVADYWGIRECFGQFNKNLFLLFFGVQDNILQEHFGRLGNYVDMQQLNDCERLDLTRILCDVAQEIEVLEKSVQNPLHVFELLCRSCVADMAQGKWQI